MIEQGARHPEVEIVVLVTDQADTLAASVGCLQAHLEHLLATRSNPGGSWRLTLVDNGSSDATAALGEHLVASLDGVDFVRLPRPLSRTALQARWSGSDAGTVSFVGLTPGGDIASLVEPVAEHVACGIVASATGVSLLPGWSLAGLRSPR